MLRPTKDWWIESLRWSAAIGGAVLWFGYIWVRLEQLGANAQQYCADRQAAAETCSYDYLPVAEITVLPAFVILAGYFFVRFAFALYAPPQHMRWLPWMFAGRLDVADSFPVPQIFAALGLCWSGFQLSILPFAFISWPVILYWIAWIIWFAAAIVVSWPRPTPDEI